MDRMTESENLESPEFSIINLTLLWSSGLTFVTRHSFFLLFFKLMFIYLMGFSCIQSWLHSASSISCRNSCVMGLVKISFGSWKGVTLEKFFTSSTLAEEMLNMTGHGHIR